MILDEVPDGEELFQYTIAEHEQCNLMDKLEEEREARQHDAESWKLCVKVVNRHDKPTKGK